MTHAGAKTNTVWNRTKLCFYSPGEKNIFFTTKTKTTIEAHNTDEYITTTKYNSSS